MNAHSIFKSKKTGSVAVIAALFSAIFLLTNSVSASPSSEPASFVAVSPYRLIDTRPGKVGNGFGGGSPYVFTVTGSGGVPYSGVTAVSLNVTVTGTEAPDYGGYVTVYPCDSPPNASSLRFAFMSLAEPNLLLTSTVITKLLQAVLISIPLTPAKCTSLAGDTPQ